VSFCSLSSLDHGKRRLPEVAARACYMAIIESILFLGPMDLWFAAPIGALLIFVLRVIDVSMSVMRMILAVRGHRGIAALIGFFEVLIWLIAVGTALQHLDSIFHIVGYAGGFAAGNYVGVWLESRFALGTNVVQAICRTDQLPDGTTSGRRTAGRLREEGFAVTEVEGRGLHSNVEILNVVVPRKRVPVVMDIIQAHDPDAFMSVEEVRSVQGGYVRPGGRKTPFLTRILPQNGMRRFSRVRTADRHVAAVPLAPPDAA
jgi:uncharacterized protein YebE (UPF0316 family)